MNFQGPLVAVPIALTMGLCLLTAGLIYRNLIGTVSESALETANEAQMAVLVFLTLWSLGQLVVVSATGLRPKLFGMSLTIAATVAAAGAWFVFALAYTGRSEWIRPSTLGAVLGATLLTALVVATNGVHQLVFVSPAVEDAGGRRVLTYQYGAAAYLIGTYNWVLGGMTVSMLFKKFLRSRNVYRKISFFHVVGGVLLVGSAFVSAIGLSPFRYLILGQVLFLSVILLSAPAVVSYRYVQVLPVDRLFAVLGRRFQNLTPMARDTIIQEMHSGVIVVDHDNCIVDLNPLGRTMIAAEDRRVIGKPLTEVVPPEVFRTDDTEFLDPDTTTGEYRGVWVETPTGGQVCYDVVVTALGDPDDPAGRVALVTDVTDREIRKNKLEQRTTELERQNEQLERFAGVVSHDLRNPLTVAKGHLETAKAVEDDRTHVEEAERSLDRMEAIVDDVLTLAREGKSIGETETVSLAAVARAAWDSVDTRAMDLVVEPDAEFEADADRLLNLFENCFRNARDHAGEDVTVTVGWDDESFFVADDGPGIPPDDREAVTEFGHTTAASGTGFGLAIVDQIAEAHGWEMAVTEGTEGGARFEFHGVEQTGLEVLD